MSLHFIIDGYNVIRHAAFNPPKKLNDERLTLMEYIKKKRLCGSLKNKVTMVFDGFPAKTLPRSTDNNTEILFSREDNADTKIKKMIEKSINPKNIVVVSDDREIAVFVRSCGVKALGVKEFLTSKEEKANESLGLLKPELTISQIENINQELKNIWLK